VTAQTYVIVPAAGGGARFGGALPKQYAPLGGVPMLVRTLERLAEINAQATVVALAPDDVHYARVVGSRPGVETIACGGATRADTVRNALAHLAARCGRDDWILVHDAARPCVPRAALDRLRRTLDDDAVGGLLAVPVADTLKRAAGGRDEEAPRVLRTEDRATLWQAQTPQMFRFRILTTALSLDGARGATDEAQAVEALAATGACGMPRLVRGSAANLKVTYGEDLALAAAILQAEE
jgi:2-C-methyl-D-erythritol 4-phosphate cytidylyltransferase